MQGREGLLIEIGKLTDIMKLLDQLKIEAVVMI